ncbi:dihydroorotase [Salegentibacter sp. HM20]
MSTTIVRNATVVNEGKRFISDLLISNGRIEKIGTSLTSQSSFREINAEGLYLFPGVIDDQVHFREPGLTHKADILTESRAAVAGGITSFMDMPNTIPNTLTQELLEEKYLLAKSRSLANYSFFMGIRKDNLEEALKTDTEKVCGITDDGLYFQDEEGILANNAGFLEKLFSRAETLVALHSEDDEIINRNLAEYRSMYGKDIPFSFHPKIRSEEACLVATKRVLEIARKHNNRLHLFHISTLAEANLFERNIDIRDKRITAEACVHHLWFSEKDYENLGSRIKWNPAIKKESDAIGLLQALNENRLDIIATDHAPHTIKEKMGNYFEAKSGGALVQHALVAMLELFHQGKISLEKLVEKMSHHVAEIYRIKERGYIREGYFADLVLVDLQSPWKVTTNNLLYKCRWSPFIGQEFQSKVTHTFVNGNLVYEHGNLIDKKKGQRLLFEKIR